MDLQKTIRNALEARQRGDARNAYKLANRALSQVPDDERLLRVRELRCLHRLPSSRQPREPTGKL